MALLTQHSFPSTPSIEYISHYSNAAAFSFGPDVKSSCAPAALGHTELSIAEASSAIASSQARPSPTPTGRQADPALESGRKRRTSQCSLEHGLRHTLSAAQIRETAMAPDSEPTTPNTSKPRNKLGYQRTSVACGHCRRRKIRCVIAPTEKSGRCQTCIKLRKECHFYPVEQANSTETRPQSMIKSDSGLSGSSAPSPAMAGSQEDDQRGSNQSLQDSDTSSASGMGRPFPPNYPAEAGFSQSYGTIWNPLFNQPFINESNLPTQWNPPPPPIPSQLLAQPPIPKTPQEQMLHQHNPNFDLGAQGRSFSVGNADHFANFNPYASFPDSGYPQDMRSRQASLPSIPNPLAFDPQHPELARQQVIPAAATPTIPSQYTGAPPTHRRMPTSSATSGSTVPASAIPFTRPLTTNAPVSSSVASEQVGFVVQPLSHSQTWPTYVEQTQGHPPSQVSAPMLGSFAGPWYGEHGDSYGQGGPPQ
ncbi:hypothetical protein P152DRAFT_205292 [Eremomyces bilateralis CBS 781.70]|uniref:Zn(2)-C6 fungal-type domain-containing protein n=1 Tax=Eremomyces bilateralis CBS 781.70 TaxID=1392243 RepID=A0A6G1FT36_9PEZI|nr:uncharacterized protein P152DRAFT_205292 [Eremomyces bilateralis CBS 781.70]KAF1808839.1 hypothetical protein P152DRAFT_205292 [Eremomyces bilateralis CBS 781.70]